MKRHLREPLHDENPPRPRSDRERCLRALVEASERVAALPAAGPVAWLVHEAAAALHACFAAAWAAQAAGASLAELGEATRPARATCARSRTFEHSQTWPLGYPGDFELIERLVDGRAEGEPGTLAHALDATVLQFPIVWQHRAKVAWQASLVRARLGARERARVLSIGCGGSRDLALLEAHELARLDVTLSDLDPRALALSRSRLEERVASLALVPGNAIRVARRASVRGPFDLIIIGGLLDYLPDRAASLLLDQALPMLAPGGALGTTNIAADNPWRVMLELVCAWPLIERSEADMTRLLARAGLSVDVSLDPSGLTWLALARGDDSAPWMTTFGHERATERR